MVSCTTSLLQHGCPCHPPLCCPGTPAQRERKPLLPGRNHHRPKPRSPLKLLSVVSPLETRGDSPLPGPDHSCLGRRESCAWQRAAANLCRTAAPRSLPFLALLLLFTAALQKMCKLRRAAIALYVFFSPPFQVDV